MNKVLDFYDSDYGRDFEVSCNIPYDWCPGAWDAPDSIYWKSSIWFKAYDVNAGTEYDETERFRNEGYEFECLIRLELNRDGHSELTELAKFGARNIDEAERLLQAAADAIFEEES